MTQSDKFEELYKKLNPEQQAAVDSIDGPVMVIAGPGTGKTQILTLRIANILKKTDLPPEAILALTFTEAGAAEMRSRLIDIVGEAAYRVRITTFHGFANDTIQNYPEHFPTLVGAQPISDTERVRLIEDLILTLPLQKLRPLGEPRHYLREVLQKLDAVKRENWRPEDFKKLIEKRLKESQSREDRIHSKGAHKGKIKGEVIKAEQMLERLLEFASIYSAYQNRLSLMRRYDYADMLIELNRALESDEDLLRTLQEENQYVLLDEHQDANGAQNKAIELILDYHPNPNLFVVGDEKQAIFRFQGASLDNFRYFEKKFAGAKVITLTENYRSTQNILDAAHGLAQKITERAAKLRGTRGEGKRLAVSKFEKPEIEAAWIASNIQERINGGVKPEEIAILFYKNSHAEEIVRALRHRGIAFRLESKNNILEDRNINRFLRLLDAAAEFGNPEYLALALHAAFEKLDALDIYNSIAHNTDTPEIAGWKNRLATWENYAKNHGLTEALHMAARESGLVSELLAGGDPEAELAKLRALLAAGSELEKLDPAATIHSFLNHLESLRTNGFELETKEAPHKVPGCVRLMTAHKSKGLQFDVVYVCRAVDSQWGGKDKGESLALPVEVYRTQTEEEEDIADKRRLFFVALTRARDTAIVTYSKLNDSGREQLPTRFLSEIEQELLEVLETADFENSYLVKPDLVNEPKPLPRLDEAAFVRERFNRLSVSALNNYLECPWKFFYLNLIYLPEGKNLSAYYGTAVHGALERFFNLYREGKGSSAELIAFFIEELGKTDISKRDYEDVRRQGEKELAAWHEKWKGSWPREAIFERKIIVSYNHLELTGQIDKIERLPSGGVRVVDYKTGKPKSRNDLLGNTKNADGNYLRQLAFYKLLLDRYEGGKYQMEEGLIDFIKPKENGSYELQIFTLTEIPYEKTIAELEAAIEDIKNFGFVSRYCGDKDCKYCDLRKSIAK